MPADGDIFGLVTSDAATPGKPEPVTLVVETDDGYAHEFLVENVWAARHRAALITEDGFVSTPEDFPTLAVVYPTHAIRRVLVQGTEPAINTQVVNRRRSH